MQYEFRGRKVKVNLNLNDEQIAAMEEIVDFIQSDRTCLTLMGYAGTGKTTLMGIVRDIFHHDIRLQFAATTHKAAGPQGESERKCQHRELSVRYCC